MILARLDGYWKGGWRVVERCGGTEQGGCYHIFPLFLSLLFPFLLNFPQKERFGQLSGGGSALLTMKRKKPQSTFALSTPTVLFLFRLSQSVLLALVGGAKGSSS